MGAPAISSPARRAKPRPAPKPRPASRPRKSASAARPAAKPRTAAKASRATAPSRRTATRPARRPVTNAGGVAMLPVAAVSGLADCGVVTRMTQSRVWIGVLGMLLGGIVALNVWGLGLSASTSATAGKIDDLQRDNGVMRKRIASRLSAQKVEAEALRLGLEMPAPDAIGYLVSRDADVAKAAARLSGGEIAAALAPVAAAPEELLVADPATPVEPAVPVDAAAAAPTTEVVTASVDPLSTDPGVVTATVDPATGALAVP